MTEPKPETEEKPKDIEPARMNAAACTLRAGTANARDPNMRVHALETLHCFGFSPFVEHEHLLNKMGGLVRSETQ